jgi:hypothetical protein
MTNSSSAPGITGIVIGTIVVSTIITLTTGDYVHWVFSLLGIVVGLMAVQVINR